MAAHRAGARPLTVWWVVLAACLVTAGHAGATSETRAERLARDFSDPLTTLPQLVLQNVYTPSS
jgi:hypothetical protein